MRTFDDGIYITIDASTFERIVREVYNIDYSIAEDMELSNDMHLVGEFFGNLSEYDDNEMEKWQHNPRSVMYMFHAIGESLAAMGEIPKGKYLIDCGW